MSTMLDAIKAQLIIEAKAALTSYYPATPTDIVNEYIGDRFDDGSPTAMSGQWYCAVHSVVGKENAKLPGNTWVDEEWSAAITITVRSAYAADSRIEYPKATLDNLMRDVTSRLRNRPWDILAAINTLFTADHALTNGLVSPFMIKTPTPQRQARNPAFLKAIEKKKTSQNSALSGTILLAGARQIQAVGDIA